MFWCLCKLGELWSMASLAYRPEIDWGLNRPSEVWFGIFNTLIPESSYHAMVYVAFGLSILYLVITY